MPRSIAMWTMLARRGIDGDLRVGVRGSAADLTSHAWVEYRGVPLVEREDHLATFTVITTESYLGL